MKNVEWSCFGVRAIGRGHQSACVRVAPSGVDGSCLCWLMRFRAAPCLVQRDAAAEVRAMHLIKSP